MDLLYLDTNVFVHALEEQVGGEPGDLARKLLRDVASGRFQAVTSELILAEVLAPNSRHGGALSPLLKRAYLNLLVFSGAIQLEPVIRDDMYFTADLRKWQKSKVKLPDLLHLATAIRLEAAYFVSNDRDIRTPDNMAKLSLSKDGLGSILAATDRLS